MQILLHKDIYIPDIFKQKALELQKKLNYYFYSKHMQEHLINLTPDRSHRYFNGDITREDIDKLIESLAKIQREVFEIELTEGKDEYYITKYCCRIPFINNQDFVIAIRPRYKKGGVIESMIVTGWLNSQDDKHFTLDESKYSSKEEIKKLLNI